MWEVSILLVLFVLVPLVATTCKLPIRFPEDAVPSGAMLGPGNSLVVVSKSGSINFADLDDFTVREDQALNGRYKDRYGAFDLGGVVATDPDGGTFLYIGMKNSPTILEYEWRDSQRISRQFSLPGLREGDLSSLAFVPTSASRNIGFFYAGSGVTGDVLIFELPLLGKTGPEAQATLKNSWRPPGVGEGSRRLAGMSYSEGYLFLSYDEGSSSHVLIYPVLDDGQCGELAEQYQLDVANAEGFAARGRGKDAWEVFLVSGKRRAVLAYDFHFVSGFRLHQHCATGAANSGRPSGGGTQRAGTPEHTTVLGWGVLLLMMPFAVSL